jgi:hypothetical protein
MFHTIIHMKLNMGSYPNCKVKVQLAMSQSYVTEMVMCHAFETLTKDEIESLRIKFCCMAVLSCSTVL